MFSSWWDAFAINCLVLLLAVALDRLLPEPPAPIHPVVWMGKAIGALERFAPKGSAAAFSYGCVAVLVVVGIATGVAWLAAEVLMSIGTWAYVIGGTLILRTTFTVRGLASAADRTRQALVEGSLDEARESLNSLVSRDAASLKPSLVAASAIESVAENTTDSYIAPWLAFAIFGLPGAVAYRAVNTLDSMLGIRGEYEYFGKAAARLDDVVNLVPARLSAFLILISGTLGRLSFRRGIRIMWRDRVLTASPNAGWTMGAMAGLLATRLEKPGHYRLGEEFPEPKPDDIGVSIRIAELTGILGLVVTLALLAARHGVFS